MLDAFLAKLRPAGEEDVTWTHLDGTRMPLRVTYFVTSEPPPLELVTSARAVVMSGGEVLVSRNRDGVHALPGGRRERDESLEETVRREVLEETGYAVAVGRRLGLIHLRHLGPRPATYGFLYPDFLQAVYVAELQSNERRPYSDDYELESAFEPLALALGLADFGSGIFVRAAVEGSAHLVPRGDTDT